MARIAARINGQIGCESDWNPCHAKGGGRAGRDRVGADRCVCGGAGDRGACLGFGAADGYVDAGGVVGEWLALGRRQSSRPD